MMKYVEPTAAIDQVENQIAQLILFRESPESMEMLPSTHLLSRRTFACLVTVREAVHRLKAVGLLRVEQGKGLFVDPLSRVRTFDSMFVETRSAELPWQRRKAISRWVRTVYFIATEALARCTRRSAAELSALSEALEELDTLLSGDFDPLDSADQLQEVIWWAAHASREDALLLGANSCRRAYPHVRRWLSAAIEPASMRNDWELVCKLFRARNTEGLRQQVARFLHAYFTRVVALSEFSDPEEEAVRRAARAGPPPDAAANAPPPDQQQEPAAPVGPHGATGQSASPAPPVEGQSSEPPAPAGSPRPSALPSAPRPAQPTVPAEPPQSAALASGPQTSEPATQEGSQQSAAIARGPQTSEPATPAEAPQSAASPALPPAAHPSSTHGETIAQESPRTCTTGFGSAAEVPPGRGASATDPPQPGVCSLALALDAVGISEASGAAVDHPPARDESGPAEPDG